MMSWEGSGAPVWDAARLRIAADAAGVGLWSWNVDTDEIAMDDRGHTLWGVRDGPLTFRDLSSRVAPPDLDRVKAAFAATRSTPGPYQLDFRIVRDDGIRWVSARGRGGDEGVVGRTMFGVGPLPDRFARAGPSPRVGEWDLWEVSPTEGYVAALAVAASAESR